jgi:thiol-disulfide isomerase/thioredoxin
LDGRITEFPKPGRVTLIDFWATSCVPCKAMMPAFEKLWLEERAQGLDVVGVASDDNPGLVAQHVKALGVSYPNVVDANAAVRGDFHVGAVPHSVVIDRQGRVRLSVQGGKPEQLEQVLDAVQSVLEEIR